MLGQDMGKVLNSWEERRKRGRKETNEDRKKEERYRRENTLRSIKQKCSVHVEICIADLGPIKITIYLFIYLFAVFILLLR
jgi:hypothetical protein